MNHEQEETLIKVINEALNRAENNWKNGGYHILHESIELSASNENFITDSESFIPGLPPIYENGHIIGDLIAFVADMRDSTKHLLQRISPKTSSVTELQRVFYETSALLPALSTVISFHKGKTTEYLGDGILAFFLVDENEPDEAIYAANRAAKDTIGDMRKIINDILNDRYRLPPLDVGVGLGMSKAIISLVGRPGDLQEVKAFGKCVFNATKLSNGRNEVKIDTHLKRKWPSSKNGILKFEPKSLTRGDHRIDGFLIKYPISN